MSQEQMKKELLAIARRPDNTDCRMPQPTWASFNLGLLMCMSCAGHHRSLGTHISRVRSITLDNWDAPSVALMGQVGNARANSYFEARLPPHQRLHPGVDDAQRGEFIRAKYANRSWYGQPAGGTAGATGAQAGGTGPAGAEQPKVLSKMEQRQARVQAKAAAEAAAAAAASATAVAQPPQQRSTSVPIPSSSSSAVSRDLPSSSSSMNLFSGMNVHAPPSALSPAAAQYAAAVAAPLPVAPAVPAVSNLLDLSAVSDTPAAHPAPGHAVDDMFAGLSVASGGSSNALGGGAAAEHHHPHVITTAASSNNASSSADLLNYYASEPASAPARSQHQSAFSFMGGNDGGTVAPPPSAAPVASSVSSSPFGFITEESDSSSAPVDPLAGVGEDSGNSHAPAAATGGADSAFSFLGGSNGADIPPAIDGSDFGNLLAPVAAAAFPLGMGIGAGGGAMPIGGGMGGSTNGMLLPAMMSAPVQAFPLVGAAPGDMFGNMNAAPFTQQQPLHMQHQQLQPPPQPHYSSQSPPQPAFGFLGGVPNGVGGGHSVAPLPYGGAFSAPAVPDFTVQSVGASQRAAAAAAQAHADDPFAHISVTASPSPSLGSQSSGYGGSGHSSSNGLGSPKAKAPHECDVEGCTGKKVSRGLCSQHLRNPAAQGSGTPQQFQQQSAVDSSFAFLGTPQQQQPMQQQQKQTDSPFNFLAQPQSMQQPQQSAPVDNSPASSFSFLS